MKLRLIFLFLNFYVMSSFLAVFWYNYISQFFPCQKKIFPLVISKTVKFYLNIYYKYHYNRLLFYMSSLKVHRVVYLNSFWDLKICPMYKHCTTHRHGHTGPINFIFYYLSNDPFLQGKLFRKLIFKNISFTQFSGFHLINFQFMH